MVMMATSSSRNRHRISPADEDSQDKSTETPMSGASRRGDCSSSSSKRSKTETVHEKPAASLDKDSEEYRRKRERNNLAVKKSRSKSKMKTQETLERVNKLRAENEMLEAKIQLLSKELGFLKDLFLAHAGNVQNQALQDLDLTIFGEPTAEGLAFTANAAPDKKAPVKSE